VFLRGRGRRQEPNHKGSKDAAKIYHISYPFYECACGY
jgi:hypothetical protein